MNTMDATAPAPTASPSRRPRLGYVDIFRGVVMAHMALDHVGWAFFNRYATPELGWLMPRYPGGWPALLTRFTGVPVAPGFAFMAGFMVAVTSKRREASGVPAAKITRRLLVRAAVLVAIALPLSLASDGILFDVLFGIGTCLVLVALIRRAPTSVLAVVAVLVFLIPPVLPPYVTAGWPGVILFSRHPIFHDGIPVLNPFPVFPWVGFMLAGLITARLTSEDPRGVKQWLNVAGIALFAFFILRLTGVFGAAYPHRGITSVSFWLFAKYPPDLVFTLWSFACIFALLALLRFLEQRERLGPLVHLASFGRVALFFYVIHMFVIAVVDHAGLPRMPIVWGYVAWACLLALLIWPCRAFWQAKLRWPASILKYL